MHLRYKLTENKKIITNVCLTSNGKFMKSSLLVFFPETFSTSFTSISVVGVKSPYLQCVTKQTDYDACQDIRIDRFNVPMY